MANLKEIRTRIASVSSTRQITSAMKMVSAAKLYKAQDVISQLRPYADKLQEIIEIISNDVDFGEGSIYAKERPLNRVLIILVTSNKGLCGAFNQNAIKRAIQLINEKYAELYSQSKVNIVAIGKKGHEYLRKHKYRVIAEHNSIFDALSFENVNELVQGFMNEFESGLYDRIELVYNKFKNAAVQDLTDELFLPVTTAPKEIEVAGEKNNGFEENGYSEFIYEPSKEYIMNNLVPKALKIKFFRALLDSHAAEHGARMTAMHKASDNADDLLKELRLNYNKERQAAITKELNEIVAGANSL